MIFLELFYTFLLIGAFTFGGGYSMIALIQNEVVVHHGWLTAEEFTDLLAVSQMTPGPIGINTATYAGYSAVVNAGYSPWAAVGGSLIASGAVIIVPVTLVIFISRWLLKHKDHPTVAAVMGTLRLAVIGLIAAAALTLLPSAFANPVHTNEITILGLHLTVSHILSASIFAAVFILSWKRKASPILLIVASGLVGLVAYSL